MKHKSRPYLVDHFLALPTIDRKKIWTIAAGPPFRITKVSKSFFEIETVLRKSCRSVAKLESLFVEKAQNVFLLLVRVVDGGATWRRFPLRRRRRRRRRCDGWWRFGLGDALAVEDHGSNLRSKKEYVMMCYDKKAAQSYQRKVGHFRKQIGITPSVP